MTIRTRALGAALTALFLASACEDPIDTGATRPNVDAQFEAWALTGSPPSFPSALRVPTLEITPVEPQGLFDLAFDIDADGRLLVLPVSRVVMPIGGNRTIGLLPSSDTYSAIIEAPRVGWAYDSVLTVDPGDAFLVRVQTLFCQFDFRQDIYAKFLVDSVLPAERRVRLSARINPNCGFRSFGTGIPEF
ncbi:MAG: hypothetical protein ACYC0B_09595 [Gemmatimonadaceae bacterium]